ncbi:putative leader peptide [Streptomyces sp. NPDC044780]|nr:MULTISPECIES: putative leader peptide [unclassified Streptomyces]
MPYAEHAISLTARRHIDLHRVSSAICQGR